MGKKSVVDCLREVLQRRRAADPPADSEEPVSRTGGVDADAVVIAETRYARSLRRSAGRASLVGMLLVAVQLLFVWLTGLVPDRGTSPLTLSPATLGLDQGGAALVLLLPASIALQVLLRMPRDHENIEPEDAIAHRQFWGHVAGVVAMSSAFVALSTFLGAAASRFPETFDVVQVFGVPVGAVMTLLIAADAATLADLEAEKLSLASSRTGAVIARIRTAIDRIPGERDPHPRRSLTLRGGIVTVLTIGAGALLVQAMLDRVGLTAAYVVFAAVLTLFAVGAALQAIPSALQARVLDTMMLLIPPALVSVVVAMEGGVTAMNLGSGDELPRYLVGLAYGFLILVPPGAVIAALILLPGTRKRSPALLATARSALEAQVERLQQVRTKSEPEPWRVFAVVAILLSPLPPASFVLVVIASWLRRSSDDTPRGLLVAAWVVTALVAALEIAALLLLPIYGEFLGWFAVS
ncbi:hypothetical protein [Microbacterium sp. NPDC087591]|uniref:hypothetical protein n=1 Tax=Microbacterium sp. NPDC087591 TaxID=3364192 RepID=UPI00380622BC